MKRPLGVILSAIVLSLAALGLLLIAAGTVFAGILIEHRPATSATSVPMPAMPHFYLYLMLAFSVFYLALAVWAILTVIGILRLRSWARYSISIIGGGIAALSLFSILMLAVTRSMMPPTPGLDPHMAKIVSFVIAFNYAITAAIGIWWLVYFNRRPIRELFRNPTLLPSSPDTCLPGQTSSSVTRAPLAITILGCFFLFGAISCIPFIFLPFPGFLLGFIIPAKGAHFVYLASIALAAFLGYGLLKLKESARLATIAFIIFGCCNSALGLLPWYQAQFRQYMAHFISLIPTMPGQPSPSYFYSGPIIIVFSLIGLGINLFLLWLLHRNRAAFIPTPIPS